MSGLHYKRDGTLDMRYSSSKTVSSGSYAGGCSYRSSSSNSSADRLHYKKDGTLDMRHSSSKAAFAGGSSGTSSSASGRHFTTCGTLDMRFSSSKEAVAIGNSNISKGVEKVPLKKDGTPDLRFKSSQISQLNKRVQNLHLRVPNGVPLTKAGYPDMRTAAAKHWVEEQAKQLTYLPEWIPRKKDGSFDTSKSLARAFLAAHDNNLHVPRPRNCRDAYYAKKIEDTNSEFRRLIETIRREDVDILELDVLPNTDEIKHALEDALRKQPKARSLMESIPSSIPLLEYKQLQSSFPDEEASLLGRGAFGVVLKGLWKGQDVAVKRLHLTQLTKQESESFISELTIIDCLGKHPNLITLHGYTLKPPCLVMEFVELGSLNHLLHYCEDEEIEANMTDGRIKKRLVIGIVNGMKQLHSVNVVHADLKPQNVLISKSFVAKITDFGLSRLRGKTTSSVASTVLEDGENVIAGTAAYMAPELLNSSQPPDFPCDVYSFGVMLNEVLIEEEPYSDQYLNFKGRGPFGPANYALQGHRPCINAEKVPHDLKKLIETCWSANPSLRPTFQNISLQLHTMNFPNSF